MFPVLPVGIEHDEMLQPESLHVGIVNHVQAEVEQLLIIARLALLK